MSLTFKDKGFRFKGGEMGVATGDVGWANGFAGVVSALVVATEGDPFDLVREPRGDFDNGELGPLGRVSAEDRLDASLVDLTALAFFFDPLGLEEKSVSWPLLQQRRPQAGWPEAE